jgi:hypothetical protein
MGIQGNKGIGTWEMKSKTEIQKDKVESGNFSDNRLNASLKIFPQKRIKKMIDLKKKTALNKLFQTKAKTKRLQILQNRKEKLEKFRINYIPLCCDEDWEMMAAFYAKNSQK